MLISVTHCTHFWCFRNLLLHIKGQYGDKETALGWLRYIPTKKRFMSLSYVTKFLTSLAWLGHGQMNWTFHWTSPNWSSVKENPVHLATLFSHWTLSDGIIYHLWFLQRVLTHFILRPRRPPPPPPQPWSGLIPNLIGRIEIISLSKMRHWSSRTVLDGPRLSKQPWTLN